MSEGVKSICVSAVKTFVNSLLVAAVSVGSIGVVYKSFQPVPLAGRELAIALAKQSMQTGVEDFAGMAKRYLNIAEEDRLDGLAQSRFRETRGGLAVKGWSAKEVEGGLYLVSYEWSNTSGDGDMGIFFEVDTKNRFARPVVPDDELSLKYGILSKEAFEKAEAITRDAIKRKYPDAAMEYANHLLTISGKPSGDYDPNEVAETVHRSLKEAFEHRQDRFLRVKMVKGTTTGEYTAKF
ncbi:hypothetical protein NR800_17260 [Corallococcus interemptor]|uniref:hypothetical protein n=1 Tax=Corallococcus interemptor TaxID=2316720 RepID=UPI0035D46273